MSKLRFCREGRAWALRELGEAKHGRRDQGLSEVGVQGQGCGGADQQFPMALCSPRMSSQRSLKNAGGKNALDATVVSVT